MPLSGPGGELACEYVHPFCLERHSMRWHVAYFDPTPTTTSYGTNDRLYIPGGPVTPTEESVLQTFQALAQLWQPYYSPNWHFRCLVLYQNQSGDMVPLLPAPVPSSTYLGNNTADDDSGARVNRRLRLQGRAFVHRRQWLSQVPGSLLADNRIEVAPDHGGLDARDRAWMNYLCGNTGGGAVMPDGTYSFPVVDMEVQWARTLEAVNTAALTGAYVQPTMPVTTGLQDHVLWVDTSVGPPYQLKVWDAETPGWLLVGIVSSAVGVDAGGHLAVDCLTFPHGAVLCNPSTDLVTLVTPTGLHQWDPTGYTLPGGHRLETVPA